MEIKSKAFHNSVGDGLIDYIGGKGVELTEGWRRCFIGCTGQYGATQADKVY